GAMAGKGVAKSLKAERMEQRVLIASGAAAGLSAAFNAPIAGLLFVVEEIYHQFSRLVWITALVASLVANFISLNIFGLTPVLDMPGDLAVLPLKHYWILLLLGAF
ncbi:TPA: chloride channel protein, partial [Bacillus anthracis]|nr:chloride channel protein [Bacillus anthracis]